MKRDCISVLLLERASTPAWIVLYVDSKPVLSTTIATAWGVVPSRTKLPEDDDEVDVTLGDADVAVTSVELTSDAAEDLALGFVFLVVVDVALALATTATDGEEESSLQLSSRC